MIAVMKGAIEQEDEPDGLPATGEVLVTEEICDDVPEHDDVRNKQEDLDDEPE